MKSLAELLSLLELTATVRGLKKNAPIVGISIDTRTIQKGEVYFALKGERFDGHQFVPDAVQKGAVACVVREDWPLPADIIGSTTIIQVRDTLLALQKLAENYRLRTSAPVLAITGTNGKTTTKEMVAAVLACRFAVLKTPGNLNNHIGLPLSLLQMGPHTEVCVVEMGTNHFGEIRRLCEIAHPTHGLITNVGAGHLEFFGTVADVARAKAELFESLPPDGVAFVNVDDPLVVQAAQSVKNKVTYGFFEDAQVTGEFMGLDKKGCARIRVDNELEIGLQIPGRHQIHNALAAVTVGKFWGVPGSEIAEALRNFRSYSKRMEIIDFQGITILLDAYNANPDSMRAAIDTLSEIARTNRGRAFAILGDMLELGDISESAHIEAGRLAAEKGVDVLMTYGRFGRHYVDGFRSNGGKVAQHFGDKEEIARELARLLRKDDVVLIKGSRGVAMETVWQQLQLVAHH